MNLEHKDPYCSGRNFLLSHYDATGVKSLSCTMCGAYAHEPLVFKSAGYIGSLYRWPEDKVPPGHESGLLPFTSPCTLDCTYLAPFVERLPNVKNPVELVFDPIDSLSHADAKDHDGIAFRQLWTDPLARTIWLGFKPFMITSQYFRAQCINIADWLRKRPDTLLAESLNLSPEGGFSSSSSMWAQSLSSQLIPYLMHQLNQEGAWPYFMLPNTLPLRWKMVAQKKVA